MVDLWWKINGKLRGLDGLVWRSMECGELKMVWMDCCKDQWNIESWRWAGEIGEKIIGMLRVEDGQDKLVRRSLECWELKMGYIDWWEDHWNVESSRWARWIGMKINELKKGWTVGTSWLGLLGGLYSSWNFRVDWRLVLVNCTVQHTVVQYIVQGGVNTNLCVRGGAKALNRWLWFRLLAPLPTLPIPPIPPPWWRTWSWFWMPPVVSSYRLCWGRSSATRNRIPPTCQTKNDRDF